MALRPTLTDGLPLSRNPAAHPLLDLLPRPVGLQRPNEPVKRKEGEDETIGHVGGWDQAGILPIACFGAPSRKICGMTAVPGRSVRAIRPG